MSNARVLIIGDSISGGYTPGVVKEMAGRIEVVRIKENGGTSRNCREHLAEWLATARPDIVHFNCGLHDIAVDPSQTTNRVPIDEYERNLREMVDRLRAQAGVSLIWARTTPVIDERHHAVKGFDRRDRDVQAYNAVADRVMAAAGVLVNDLYAVVGQAGLEECISKDGVHMTDNGNAVLASAVVAAIDGAIRRRPGR